MNPARQKQILTALAHLPENSRCVDCNYSPVTWCSINLSVFLCMNCAGAHRSLGTHISQVRSLTLDKMTQQQVDNMHTNTNVRFNIKYEAKLQSSSSNAVSTTTSASQPARPTTIGASRNRTIGSMATNNTASANTNNRFMGGTSMRSLGMDSRKGMTKPLPTASDDERFSFIKNKYEFRLFYDDIDDSPAVVDAIMGRNQPLKEAPPLKQQPSSQQTPSEPAPPITVIDLFDINQPPGSTPQQAQSAPQRKTQSGGKQFAFQVLKKHPSSTSSSSSSFNQLESRRQSASLSETTLTPQSSTGGVKATSQFNFQVKRRVAPAPQPAPAPDLFSGLTQVAPRKADENSVDFFSQLQDTPTPANGDDDNDDDDGETAFAFLNDDEDGGLNGIGSPIEDDDDDIFDHLVEQQDLEPTTSLSLEPEPEPTEMAYEQEQTVDESMYIIPENNLYEPLQDIPSGEDINTPSCEQNTNIQSGFPNWDDLPSPETDAGQAESEGEYTQLDSAQDSLNQNFSDMQLSLDEEQYGANNSNVDDQDDSIFTFSTNNDDDNDAHIIPDELDTNPSDLLTSTPYHLDAMTGNEEEVDDDSLWSGGLLA